MVFTAEKESTTKKSLLARYSWVFSILLLLSPTIAHSLFGYGVAPVLSGSMRPGLNPGDLLLTQETLAMNVTAKEVVVFQNPKDHNLYAHRILTIIKTPEGLRITTKGDGNPVADSQVLLINPLQKVPRAVGQIKYFGWVLVFITSSSGQIFGAILFGFALLLGFVRFLILRSERRKMRAPTSSVKSQPTLFRSFQKFFSRFFHFFNHPNNKE